MGDSFSAREALGGKEDSHEDGCTTLEKSGLIRRGLIQPNKEERLSGKLCSLPVVFIEPGGSIRRVEISNSSGAAKKKEPGCGGLVLDEGVDAWGVKAEIIVDLGVLVDFTAELASSLKMIKIFPHFLFSYGSFCRPNAAFLHGKSKDDY